MHLELADMWIIKKEVRERLGTAAGHFIGLMAKNDRLKAES